MISMLKNLLNQYLNNMTYSLYLTCIDYVVLLNSLKSWNTDYRLLFTPYLPGQKGKITSLSHHHPLTTSPTRHRGSGTNFEVMKVISTLHAHPALRWNQDWIFPFYRLKTGTALSGTTITLLNLGLLIPKSTPIVTYFQCSLGGYSLWRYPIVTSHMLLLYSSFTLAELSKICRGILSRRRN